MNFVVSAVHSVNNLGGAVAFLCDVLGFQQKLMTDRAAVVENGALAIRLVQVHTDCSSANLLLELYTQDRHAALQQLLDETGVSVLQKTTDFSHQERVESLLQAPYGIQILLVQEFNEDQLGIMPPLPMALMWEEDAEVCVKKMLQVVPLGFRQSARVRVTERAEMRAGEQASIMVTLEIALQALADTTPPFQQPALIAALQVEGIDTAPYFNQKVV